MKLTRADHEARAQLLGRTYDCRDGTYCLASEGGDGITSDGMIDCVTLEPVSDADAVKRLNNPYVKYSMWSTRNQTPTQPWELPDNEGQDQ